MIEVTHTTSDNGILVFTLNGDLRIAGAEETKNQINSMISSTGAKKVVLNLADLTFLDSAGIAVFISAYKKLAVDGGRLAICCLGGHPKSIIEISNLQKIIDVYPNLDDALEALA